MILSQPQIREEVEKGSVKFDPPLTEKQWGGASVDLRLGCKFTRFRPSKHVTFSLAGGIGALSETGLWDEIELRQKNAMGKKDKYVLEPGEFILALTHEHVWIPRHLIAMVEGRSTYARAGLSMHQTAPWIQPGWDGQITLEIRNSGTNNIELTPLDDMPCQLTFFQLTSEVPAKHAYGSRAGDVFQNQTSALPIKGTNNG